MKQIVSAFDTAAENRAAGSANTNTQGSPTVPNLRATSYESRRAAGFLHSPEITTQFRFKDTGQGEDTDQVNHFSIININDLAS